MTEHLLDGRQAAAYVGLGHTAFEQLVRDGRRYTFRRAELDEWVDANRVKPGELTHLAGTLATSDRYLRGGSRSPRRHR
jgi:hypothetical protein